VPSQPLRLSRASFLHTHSTFPPPHSKQAAKKKPTKKTQKAPDAREQGQGDGFLLREVGSAATLAVELGKVNPGGQGRIREGARVSKEGGGFLLYSLLPEYFRAAKLPKLKNYSDCSHLLPISTILQSSLDAMGHLH